MVYAVLALMASSINASNSCMRSSNTTSSEEDVEEAAEGRGSGCWLSFGVGHSRCADRLAPTNRRPARQMLPCKISSRRYRYQFGGFLERTAAEFFTASTLISRGQIPKLGELERELLHILLVSLPCSVFTTCVPFEPSTVLPSTPHTHRRVICIHYSLLRSDAARLDDRDKDSAFNLKTLPRLRKVVDLCQRLSVVPSGTLPDCAFNRSSCL